MKLQINRDLLAEAVSFAVKLLPQRTTLPILGGILLEAQGGDLHLATFDYEVSSQTAVAADIETEGSVLVSGRLLADISSKLPGDEVTLSLEDGKLLVVSSAARFELYTMPLEEYPSLPQIDQWVGTVDAEKFADAIAQVAVAASRDDVTPVITGVQIEIDESELTFLATDRYRVAVRGIEWNNDGQAEGNALVPARTLNEVAKTFAHQGSVKVALIKNDDREIIAFSANRRTVTSLLIKGNYPPVRRLFPDTVENYAVVNTAELIEAVRRVSLVLDRESPLRFTFNLDGVTLDAAGNDQAQARERVEAFLTGDEVVISMKPQFLIDGLNSTRCEFAKMAFTKTDNPHKPGPVLITGQTSKDGEQPGAFKYLLQPNLLLR
ncbi:DNA polymerase III subunit beta [Pseudoclavibacter sp. CFCC 11306]|uniref:DNA polymerase III subunit beta n=1 Tax=Pseudoclavibacter sp. CFCC 11306 TaxID=1564493 RepID=UPI0013014309|nr:DNA polymerase III subunit beta [Pseudoclavibacter sp. CFCC 11306]KAB1657423.1 DNA polymerase III subunit beta [Pseudoclavibacter sp. CFCC 11306]